MSRDAKIAGTGERLAHILEHPEMRDLASAIELTLRQPQFVRRSRSDAAARLLYPSVTASAHNPPFPDDDDPAPISVRRSR